MAWFLKSSNIWLYIWITNTYENNFDGVVDGDGDEDDLMMRIVRTPIRWKPSRPAQGGHPRWGQYPPPLALSGGCSRPCRWPGLLATSACCTWHAGRCCAAPAVLLCTWTNIWHAVLCKSKFLPSKIFHPHIVVALFHFIGGTKRHKYHTTDDQIYHNICYTSRAEAKVAAWVGQGGCCGPW